MRMKVLAQHFAETRACPFNARLGLACTRPFDFACQSLGSRLQSHSWLNNHMKGLKWAFNIYPRPADASVQDLRKLKAVQDVLKVAKERDANRTKEYVPLQLGDALHGPQNRQLYTNLHDCPPSAPFLSVQVS